MNDKEKLIIIKYLANAIKKQYEWGGELCEAKHIPDHIRDEMDMKIGKQIEDHYNRYISTNYALCMEVWRLANMMSELTEEDYKHE